MDGSRTKVGVIGVGRMGEYHLRKYLSLGDVELVGFYESDPLRAKEISERYSIPSISDVDILLYEVDAVTIATPTATHFPLARKALESGVHVLVEKPISETVAEAHELAELAQRNRLELHVGMVERFRFAALVKELPIGKPTHIQAFRLNTSLGREPSLDVITDLMIHDIDLVCSILKERVHKVLVSGAKITTDNYDEAQVCLIFQSGATASLSTSRVAFSLARAMRIVGNGFLCELDFVSNTSRGYVRSDSGVAQDFRFERKGLDALGDEIGAFISCVRGEKVPHVGALEAAETLSIVLELLRALEATPKKRRARSTVS